MVVLLHMGHAKIQTDALEKMERQNYGEASALLIAAQQKAEELYMDSDGE